MRSARLRGCRRLGGSFDDRGADIAGARWDAAPRNAGMGAKDTVKTKVAIPHVNDTPRMRTAREALSAMEAKLVEIEARRQALIGEFRTPTAPRPNIDHMALAQKIVAGEQPQLVDDTWSRQQSDYARLSLEANTIRNALPDQRMRIERIREELAQEVMTEMRPQIEAAAADVVRGAALVRKGFEAEAAIRHDLTELGYGGQLPLVFDSYSEFDPLRTWPDRVEAAMLQLRPSLIGHDRANA